MNNNVKKEIHHCHVHHYALLILLRNFDMVPYYNDTTTMYPRRNRYDRM